jgi:putative transposase
MIDRSHALPLARQVRELGISRGSIYYLPKPVSAADLAIMRRIDELHLEFPFTGSRMLRDLLRQEGVEIGRQHVATLMKKMAIVRPNQVWATDISYIPMAKGFVYLVAIVDWFSRKVLAWRVSITMEADFCVEALEEALACFGKPEIFNTDSAANSRAWPSPACCSAKRSPSAWTAGARGAQ